jgi:2-polyprenyl-3-methyl-5-hydroxy-6-metoxy-1,4-benzoquinol methylase
MMTDNFDGARFSNKAPGFESPNQSPDSDDLARRWQAANKAWWERTPMRYDWREAIPFPEGTKEYFEHIDRRFLEAVRHYLPWHRLPFEQLIPYDALRNLDVLEIGVGQGTHAQLIARHCKSFVGIDLTETAAKATGSRLRLAGIHARIFQMDAEHMAFADQAFDFVWSWGVIHHSSNTQRVLAEMARVLRPGGKAVVMVYYRSPIQYYLLTGLGRGFLKGEFWSVGGIHRINQAATDGALARFFSIAEFSRLAQGMFVIDKTFITGQKVDAFPILHGRLKSFLLANTPDSIARFITNVLRLGTFLIVRLNRT